MNTLVETVEINNISGQTIFVNVQPLPGSPIYTGSGNTIIKSKARLQAESSRFDTKQLDNLRNLNLITYDLKTLRIHVGGTGTN